MIANTLQPGVYHPAPGAPICLATHSDVDVGDLAVGLDDTVTPADEPERRAAAVLPGG